MTKFIKLQDWQVRFEAFIKARRALPFAWGSNDCAIFAADCVQALTGQDAAPAGLRNHTTEKQAARSLERHGGLSGIATAALGDPMPVSQACIGDVVLCKAGKRDMLAICNGATALAPSSQGLISVSMSDASMCWRVA